jgi:uncharacterized protein (UPF0335 family)
LHDTGPAQAAPRKPAKQPPSRRRPPETHLANIQAAIQHIEDKQILNNVLTYKSFARFVGKKSVSADDCLAAFVTLQDDQIKVNAVIDGKEVEILTIDHCLPDIRRDLASRGFDSSIVDRFCSLLKQYGPSVLDDKPDMDLAPHRYHLADSSPVAHRIDTAGLPPPPARNARVPSKRLSWITKVIIED